MSTELIVAMAMIGWVGFFLLLGIIIGKGRKAGGAPMKSAEVWMPQMEEPPEEEDDTFVAPIFKKRQVDAVDHQWSPKTIDQGVEALRAGYAANGIPVSTKELRAEVELMLNSDNGEID